VFGISVSDGYIPWWSFQLQWLAFSLTTTSITVVLAAISPHVWNLWRKNLHRCCYIAIPPVNIIID